MMKKPSHQKVLIFIKSLLKNQGNQSSILEFAGAFNENDLQEMKSAIANGCERIDKDEW